MGYIQIVSCITESSGYGSIPGERDGRNMAASISGSAEEEKRCSEREGERVREGGRERERGTEGRERERARRLGSCQGHLRELSGEADL